MHWAQSLWLILSQVKFHFPEPTELVPPLIQLIDVDFQYPGRDDFGLQVSALRCPPSPEVLQAAMVCLPSEARPRDTLALYRIPQLASSTSTCSLRFGCSYTVLLANSASDSARTCA